MKWLLKGSVLALAPCMLVQALFGHEEQKVRVKDIPIVMQRILHEHVKFQKESPELIGRALKVYVDQFDPLRSYLLSAEAGPLVNVPKEQLDIYFLQYTSGNYSCFNTANQVFQEAILRARKMRSSIRYANMKHVMREIVIAEQDPVIGQSIPFASNTEDLEKRIKLAIARQIRTKAVKVRQEKLDLSFEDVVTLVMNDIQAVENSYLNIGADGTMVPPAERENAFAERVLKALTASLDAHSSFMDPTEAHTLQMKLQKGFDGIGIEVEKGVEGYLVSKVIPGSSAEQSKLLQKGDHLLAIDGTKTKSLELDDVIDRLQGNVGSKVMLEIERTGAQPSTIELTRQHVILQDGRVDVASERFEQGYIGKITLHSFYDGTDDISSVNDVKKAIQDLKKKGPLVGLVIDLRDNRGGYLMQAVNVAGLFMKSGVVVVAKTQDGKERFFRDLDPAAAYSGPMIILTSRATASAAEIVAAALKDYGIAIIVGDDHTYGKGSIQMQTVTTEKDSLPMKVTVGKYYSVTGETIQGVGVKADIVVPSALCRNELGEQYLYFPLESDKATGAMNDTLADVPQESREWYMKYYLPYLQTKENRYTTIIPELQRRSGERLKRNGEYAAFIAGKPIMHKVTKSDKEEIVTLNDAEAKKHVWDMQMQEAVSIMKDLLELKK